MKIQYLLHRKMFILIVFAFVFLRSSKITVTTKAWLPFSMFRHLKHLVKISERFWSESLSFNYLDKPSSDRLHTWRVYCLWPTEVRCRVWSCLDEQFSRKQYLRPSNRPVAVDHRIIQPTDFSIPKIFNLQNYPRQNTHTCRKVWEVSWNLYPLL